MKDQLDNKTTDFFQPSFFCPSFNTEVLIDVRIKRYKKITRKICKCTCDVDVTEFLNPIATASRLSYWLDHGSKGINASKIEPALDHGMDLLAQGYYQ